MPFANASARHRGPDDCDSTSLLRGFTDLPLSDIATFIHGWCLNCPVSASYDERNSEMQRSVGLRFQDGPAQPYLAVAGNDVRRSIPLGRKGFAAEDFVEGLILRSAD